MVYRMKFVKFLYEGTPFRKAIGVPASEELDRVFKKVGYLVLMSELDGRSECVRGRIMGYEWADRGRRRRAGAKGGESITHLLFVFGKKKRSR